VPVPLLMTPEIVLAPVLLPLSIRVVVQARRATGDRAAEVKDVGRGCVVGEGEVPGRCEGDGGIDGFRLARRRRARPRSKLDRAEASQEQTTTTPLKVNEPTLAPLEGDILKIAGGIDRNRDPVDVLKVAVLLSLVPPEAPAMVPPDQLAVFTQVPFEVLVHVPSAACAELPRTRTKELVSKSEHIEERNPPADEIRVSRGCDKEGNFQPVGAVQGNSRSRSS